MLTSQPRLLSAYVPDCSPQRRHSCVRLSSSMGYRLESPLVVFCLALATAVSERWSVPISATTDLTIYLLPTVFAAVVFGPLAAGLVAAASMLGDPELFRRGNPRPCAVAQVGELHGGELHYGRCRRSDRTSLQWRSVGAIVAATFAAMAAAEASDFLFAIITAQVRRRSMHELATHGCTGRADVLPRLRASRCRACPRLHQDLAGHDSSLRRPNTRIPAAVRAVPARTTAW